MSHVVIPELSEIMSYLDTEKLDDLRLDIQKNLNASKQHELCKLFKVIMHDEFMLVCEIMMLNELRTKEVH